MFSRGHSELEPQVTDSLPLARRCSASFGDKHPASNGYYAQHENERAARSRLDDAHARTSAGVETVLFGPQSTRGPRSTHRRRAVEQFSCATVRGSVPPFSVFTRERRAGCAGPRETWKSRGLTRVTGRWTRAGSSQEQTLRPRSGRALSDGRGDSGCRRDPVSPQPPSWDTGAGCHGDASSVVTLAAAPPLAPSAGAEI